MELPWRSGGASAPPGPSIAPSLPTAAEAMQQPVSAEKRGCIFYKLIVQSIIQEKELGIPKKFGQKFGDKLSDVVTLIDCNLAKWKIGLRRLNHRLWFHHGWPKFVEDHSIHAGSFLIFKYEENSNFAVYIYDLAASEMKASLDSAGPSSEPAQPEQIEVASVRSPQSKDIYRTVMLPSASKTSKDKPFVKCGAETTSSVVADSIVREKPAPKTGTRVDVDELTETHPNSKWKRRLMSELDGCHNKKKPGMEVHDKKGSFLKWKRRSREVTDEERRRVVLAAENFKSDFPFCRIMMRVSYVYYKFDLIFPSEFSKKYLKDIQGVIELQDPNGRKWLVRCSCKGNGARVTTGWRGFVLENNLDDGDVCIFELVQRDDIVLKVSIFRASNPEEVVQVSSESMPKSIPSMVVDNIPVERREQEVNHAQHSGIGREDYANDFMEKLNEDIDIIVPQNLVPGCSKDNNAFAECMAEKTSSNIPDSVGWLPFEMRDKPVQEIGVKDNADHLMEFRKEVNNLYLANQPKLPNNIWKRRLISELGDCCKKKKVNMEACNKASSLKWKRTPRTDIALKVSIFRAANPEELVHVSSESMPENVSAMAVDDDITLEGREEEVNFAQHLGTEDYANDFVEKLNEDIDIFVPQNLAGCSKDNNNGFVEFMAEKTSSNIADSVGWLPFEMGDNPVQEIGTKVNADHLMGTRKDINNLYLANQPKSISELDDCCNKKNMEMEVRNKVSSFKWKRRPLTVTDEEKRQAVHAAANFASQFPFCRMVMQPSYVYSNFGLFLPAGFSKKYLLGIQGPITLQDSNGRKWPARFQYRKSSAVITSGWREFVVDNNLDDGDVCIFELVQVEEDVVVLKVSIFRATAIPEEEIVQVSGESVPENVSAMVVDNIPLEVRGEEVNFAQYLDTEDYANGFMEKLNEDIDIIVPQNLAPGCSEDINAFVECMAEKTSSNIADTIDWPPLEMRDRPVQRTGMRVDANHLMETGKEINNLYLANQPKSPNCIWKRRLTSGLDDCGNKKKVKKKEARDKASSLKWKRRPRTVTDEEKIQAIHAAANFTSEFPFCRMVMQPSYVYSNFNLYLPANFSKKYLLGIRGPISLQDSNGRKWPAQCRYRYRNSNAIITRGWREFVVDNNLDGGDVCIFELVHMEEETVLLKVSIFRAATNPEEEIVQVYGESMPQKIVGSEQEVNLAQRVDIEDYANDFMEKSNEDAYAEMGTRGDAQQEANNFDLTDQPKLPDSEWKRTLTSELDECSNKKEAEMEVRNKASSLKWKRRSRAVTDEEKRLAVHAAANFKSKFPFCRMVMSPSYVYYNFVLYLPAGFSRKHLKDIRVVTLRDPNGRECLARCSNSRDSTVMLRKGWRKFVVDNNLHDGDVCIFELVQKEDDAVVLKVSIFRAAKPEVVQ